MKAAFEALKDNCDNLQHEIQVMRNDNEVQVEYLEKEKKTVATNSSIERANLESKFKDIKTALEFEKEW